ncbi:hypothetical protein SAMN04488168_13923 [Bacillus sp. 491mf]|nr:hypothetical protein SAMN04488168_13923 [Bacillus sp. 491mf]
MYRINKSTETIISLSLFLFGYSSQYNFHLSETEQEKSIFKARARWG